MDHAQPACLPPDRQPRSTVRSHSPPHRKTSPIVQAGLRKSSEASAHASARAPAHPCAPLSARRAPGADVRPYRRPPLRPSHERMPLPPHPVGHGPTPVAAVPDACMVGPVSGAPAARPRAPVEQEGRAPWRARGPCCPSCSRWPWPGSRPRSRTRRAGRPVPPPSPRGPCTTRSSRRAPRRAGRSPWTAPYGPCRASAAGRPSPATRPPSPWASPASKGATCCACLPAGGSTCPRGHRCRRWFRRTTRPPRRRSRRAARGWRRAGCRAPATRRARPRNARCCRCGRCRRRAGRRSPRPGTTVAAGCRRRCSVGHLAVIPCGPSRRRDDRLRGFCPMVRRAADHAARSLGPDGLPPASPDCWELATTTTDTGTAAPLPTGLNSAAYLAAAVGMGADAERWGDAARRRSAGIAAAFAPWGYQRTVDGRHGRDARWRSPGPVRVSRRRRAGCSTGCCPRGTGWTSCRRP